MTASPAPLASAAPSPRGATRTVRIALAQLNSVVGALSANADAILGALRSAEAAGCDLVVTPELALTGYPPEDLLMKAGFLGATQRALSGLAERTGSMALVVGAPLADHDLALEGPEDARDRPPAGRVANALAVLADGAQRASVAKRLLPNYDVFDERRYFAPAAGPAAPVDIAGLPVGLLVCEDVWVADGPAAQLAAAGARLLVVANASPFARGRRLDRERVAADRARETGLPVVYANLVGGQDELVFDGQSFVVDPGGRVVARAGAFVEELLIVDVEVAGDPGPVREPVVARLAEPPGPVEEVHGALVLGTRDYARKNGFHDVVVNVSGGIDSALVAAIAVEALGAEHVRGFAMPSRYSSGHSVTDAYDLARRTGFRIDTVPIEAAHRALGDSLAAVLGTEPAGLVDENLQSRIRGLLLMALSNATGALVLTTGNKSELATGYFTLYGDSVGGFAVIKDVPKVLVYAIARWMNERALALGSEPPIPESVLVKAPSAELRPGQRDDQSLPPYETLDPLLEEYVEGDATADEMMARGEDPELVRRIARLVDLAEYKRRQMPPGVRVSAKAFGKDRRMPITNAYRPDPR